MATATGATFVLPPPPPPPSASHQGLAIHMLLPHTRCMLAAAATSKQGRACEGGGSYGRAQPGPRQEQRRRRRPPQAALEAATSAATQHLLVIVPCSAKKSVVSSLARRKSAVIASPGGSLASRAIAQKVDPGQLFS